MSKILTTRITLDQLKHAKHINVKIKRYPVIKFKYENGVINVYKMTRKPYIIQTWSDLEIGLSLLNAEILNYKTGHDEPSVVTLYSKSQIRK